LLTLAEAKSAVNLPSGTSTQDDSLALYVSGISRRIDSLCGNVVQRSVTAERHDGGASIIMLDQHYATAISSFSEWQNGGEVVLTAETDSTKPANGYLLEPGNPYSFVYRRMSGVDATFRAGRRNLIVSYTSGRVADTASVDAQFKLAASAVLRRVWKRESSGWSQQPSFYSDTENPADPLQFYRAVDPMVREFLNDQLLPPVGIY
jgi:hypothetical protein